MPLASALALQSVRPRKPHNDKGVIEGGRDHPERNVNRLGIAEGVESMKSDDSVVAEAPLQDDPG